jgi:hypothetical protein
VSKAFACAILLLAGLPASAIAQTSADACELHVWGARKSFPANSKFAAPFALKGTFHADRSEPLANINVTDPVLRLSRIPDSSFDDYFGEGIRTEVIRHAETLDPSAALKSKVPLSPRSAACSGDLILSNIVDVEGPSQDPGLLVSMLMAPAGMNMQITFRRFDASGQLVYAKRDGVNGSLMIPRSKWGVDQTKALAAIDESVANGVRDYAIEHLLEKKTDT